MSTHNSNALGSPPTEPTTWLVRPCDIDYETKVGPFKTAFEARMHFAVKNNMDPLTVRVRMDGSAT